MGYARKVSRVLFGAFVFLGVIWFLLVGILSTEEMSMVTTVASTGNLKHWKMIAQQSHATGGVHRELNFNYVSKRRVPNGPDPIHNRRAVKSRQPPGRA